MTYDTQVPSKDRPCLKENDDNRHSKRSQRLLRATPVAAVQYSLKEVSNFKQKMKVVTASLSKKSHARPQVARTRRQASNPGVLLALLLSTSFPRKFLVQGSSPKACEIARSCQPAMSVLQTSSNIDCSC